MQFFADTYALVDFVRGNKAYRKYFDENEIITTRLNLLELYYWTIKNDSQENAEEYYDSFLKNTLEIEDETLKKAAQFRLEHKKQNISYIDAIGYKIALEKNIKFLTGDREFKNMENVEFVK